MMKLRQIFLTLAFAVFATCLAIITVNISTSREEFVQQVVCPIIVPEIIVPQFPETNFTSIVQRTISSIVQIQVRGQQRYRGWGNYYNYPFYFSKDEKEFSVISYGSGVILTSDGYIITNNHVIKDAKGLDVVLYDNRVCKATIVGTYPDVDLAVIKIEENDLSFLIFGNSDALRVGEKIIVIGAPYKLVSTVTVGIVSAKARTINIIKTKQALESFIQIDAAVNSGNSGGALIDTRGKLVGINSAIYSYNKEFCGLAFAIPSTIVQKVFQDIVKYDTVYRPFLGVTVANLNAKLAKKYNNNCMDGIIVIKLEPEGAANQAGIKINDVIVVVNGIPVDNFIEFQEQIFRYSPNDQISIVLYHTDFAISLAPILKKVQKDVILRDIQSGIDTKEK